MIRRPDMSAELAKVWRLATAPLRVLPDFILPGAPKCGSSTLYNCVTRHPRIRRASRKEPTNFILHPASEIRCRMHFPFAILRRLQGGYVTCEASVSYFAHPDAPASCASVVPRARLIFVLRDPVARAWSDFQMCSRTGLDRERFEPGVRRAMRWLDDPSIRDLRSSAMRWRLNPLRYVATGLYLEHLEHWMCHFPRSQCAIFLSEEFFADPEAVTRQACAHLGLPPFPLDEVPSARIGDYKTGMDPQLERDLRAFFAPHNERLAAFLGRELPWR